MRFERISQDHESNVITIYTILHYIYILGMKDSNHHCFTCKVNALPIKLIPI